MKLSEFSRIKWERARDLKGKGELSEAERELREALEEQPDHPLLNASLADLYLRQDRAGEAKVLAESVLSREPENAQALFVLGKIRYNENDLEDALACFRRAFYKDKRPYTARWTARTLRKMDRYGEAEELVDSALAAEPENVYLLKEKALILNRLEKREEALKTYEKIAGLDPGDRFVRKEIYRLKSLGRGREQVIKELEKVLTLPARKDDPELHALLGQKLRDAGRLKEAAEAFRAAWNRSNGNPFFLKQEGFCHNRRGAYPEAIEALSRAFKEDPDDYRVKTTLKKLYTVTKNPEGFVSLLEEILKEHPHHVKLMGTLKSLTKKGHGKTGRPS